jgi:hypothetical protein
MCYRSNGEKTTIITCLAIPTRDLTAVERSREAMRPVNQKSGERELSLSVQVFVSCLSRAMKGLRDVTQWTARDFYDLEELVAWRTDIGLSINLSPTSLPARIAYLIQSTFAKEVSSMSL